jgi:hypothetical protein
VIHRDVKPANLWLEAPSGRVKVLDFGLARLAGGDAGLTGSGVVLGTPSYMAPEQAEGEVDARADLFSLGCVLYRMATGRLPFPGKTPMAALREVALLDPPPPRQINPDLPEALSRLIECLLSKAPAGRPDSAAVVVQALEQVQKIEAVPMPPDAAKPQADDATGEQALRGDPAPTSHLSPPSRRPATARPVRRKRFLWVSAAGLLLAGAMTLAALALRPNGSRPAGSEPPPDRLQVLGLDVKHHGTVDGQRRWAILGKGSWVTHGKDSVEVDARLSRPAYAFLIAFRPDGSELLCLPEKEDEKPPQTDRFHFPPKRAEEESLDEGTGLYAFAVVVSSQPLPPWKEWWSRAGCPWQKMPPDGVWRAFDSKDVEELTPDPSLPRSRKEVAAKAAVLGLAEWLSKRPQVEALEVLAFPVLPKEKP